MKFKLQKNDYLSRFEYVTCEIPTHYIKYEHEMNLCHQHNQVKFVYI